MRSERESRLRRKEAESGGAVRVKNRAAHDHLADLPRHTTPQSPASLPRRLWQAGNSAIGWLFSRWSRSGQPLPQRTQTEMEQAFGTDFSDVRLHDNPSAQATAEAMNANAFTHGDDIYFGADVPSPESSAGRKLLAHELAHVMQQKRAGEQQTDTVNSSKDTFEADADRAAAAASTGQPVQIAATETPPAVQRQEREEGFVEQQLRNLLNRALSEGVAYDSKQGWKVGGLPVREIPRGAELLGRIARGDLRGAIEMFRPRDPRERDRLREETRRLREELDRLRPAEERQREQERVISEAARLSAERLGLGTREPSEPRFRLPEPKLDLQSSGLQPGTTTHWMLDKFRLESAALEPYHRRRLNDLANQAKSTPNAEIEIIGHADTTGPLAFNQNLSEQRANAVRDYLLSRGVEASKIKAVTGRGEEEPLVPEHAEADRARNRRVEIFFWTGVTQRTESRFRLPPLRLTQ